MKRSSALLLLICCAISTAFAADSVPILLQGLPGTGGMANLTICDNDNAEDICFYIEKRYIFGVFIKTFNDI